MRCNAPSISTTFRFSTEVKFLQYGPGRFRRKYRSGGLEIMAGKVKHIPEGWHAVTPYLVVKGAARAIEFYSKVFGAKEVMRLAEPGGKIGHAEIKIGG